MKANFHRNPKRSKSVRAIIAACVIFLVLYLFGSVLDSLFSYAVKPVLFLRTYFAESTAAFPTYIRGRTELEHEMDALRNELTKQSGKQATIERLTKENEVLKELIGITQDERIGAGIIARPPFVPYDSLVIDRGSSDGVVEGALVFEANDHVIGTVTRVFPGSSLITLFSSPGVASTVYVFGPDIFTTAYGDGGGVVRLSIPQGLAIEEGDVVVLPRADSGIVGTVHIVESIPTQPEQRAYVTTPISIQGLRYVSVSTRVPETITFEEAEAYVREAAAYMPTLAVPPGSLAVPITATSTGTTTDIEVAI